MINTNQIRLIQIAVRQVDLRTKQQEGRYRLLLGQYLQPNGQKVTSCKQLNHEQFEDILAICESMGFRQKGKADDFYRKKTAAKGNMATPGQKLAIDHIAGDMGWTVDNLNVFISKMVKRQATTETISTKEGSKLIDALKAIISRKDGKHYDSITEIAEQYSA